LIDRWIAWVDGQRAPPWVVYGVAFVLVALLATGPGWLDGSMPLGRFRSLELLLAFWAVFPVALMHHLDHFAARALRVFQPVMDADEREIESWHRALTTMSAWPAALAALAGATFEWVVFIVNPELSRAISSSELRLAIGRAILTVNFAFLGTLIYHTVRQLSLVTRIYARATRLDLLRLSPLYAFSGLTARTGIAWAAALYLSVALFPDFLQSQLALGFLALQILLVLVAFAWPLLGIHGRLEAEKDRALGEIGRRLSRALAELEARTDAMNLADMDSLNKMVTALAAGRELLLKVPTWPWNPGTPLAVLTTLLLPVGVYLVQRLLEDLIGL
jgi:hypothetical protein